MLTLFSTFSLVLPGLILLSLLIALAWFGADTKSTAGRVMVSTTAVVLIFAAEYIFTQAGLILLGFAS